MSSNNKIVIGSGLSGPLLALYLSQRGYSVDLYEKRPDLRLENISVGRSINLALSHRGIMALKSANVFDEIDPLLIHMKGRIVHLLNREVEFQPYSIHSHEHINSVSRGELNKILMTSAEASGKVQIHFNHSLSEIDDSNNKLVFENGNRVSFTNHILGADGAGSVIRRFIDKKVSLPSYTNSLGHDYKEMHIAPGNDGNFQLDSNALHIWPREGFMLIALPNMDQSFTCTLFLKSKGEISFESLKDHESVIQFFSEYFEDVLPLLENFPETFLSNPTGKLATVYAEEWHYDNKFCLVGDAAHAIVPFFGQGMNASFEDCEILMNTLDSKDDNWDMLFENFSSNRKSDGHAIARMAIENYVEMRDLVTKKEFLKDKNTSNILWKRFPDRFIPRYNMVSFTSIPYSEVYRRGEIQAQIIKDINPENPNLKLAEKLIIERLNPIL